MDDAMLMLLDPLTEARRAHSIAVGRRMESLAGRLPSVLRADAIAAAYLHDVGYGHPDVGFHPVDGARLLRSRGYSAVVCHIVAFHTAAEVEADVRGLEPSMFEPFALHDVPGLRIADDLMWWADLSVGPNGETMTVDQRLSEILSRYEAGSVVHTAITRAEPLLREAVQRVSGSM
ncbi:putative nucleotidyltransferase with HDIG domain [Nocardia kruczakiae]|uniref:Nucleotidyltransferase with HDIG domain n=1 Tax=Nocardia kruczakiae TaxID=261477 RepID=A0ABU1XA12_9NOCA|nr:HD domain-containing protein [Nocardia kruczakiae]MDR7166916.1 putative nucleotidyltransferase with HDIG domain [Nocardia kruczakiae]